VEQYEILRPYAHIEGTDLLGNMSLPLTPHPLM
jgi:hypothetical protein